MHFTLPFRFIACHGPDGAPQQIQHLLATYLQMVIFASGMCDPLALIALVEQVAYVSNDIKCAAIAEDANVVHDLSGCDGMPHLLAQAARALSWSWGPGRCWATALSAWILTR